MSHCISLRLDGIYNVPIDPQLKPCARTIANLLVKYAQLWMTSRRFFLFLSFLNSQEICHLDVHFNVKI